MQSNKMMMHHHHPREERRYSVPHGPNAPLPPAASEDLHAWSIYRQVNYIFKLHKQSANQL